MAKQSQIHKAIEVLAKEREVLDLAIAKLQQQLAQVKPRLRKGKSNVADLKQPA